MHPMVDLVVNRVRHGVYPLNAVGAIHAQKDRTDSVTSSFHVQPLVIWALAYMSMLWGTWPW